MTRPILPVAGAAALALCLLAVAAPRTGAKPEYATREKSECLYCHTQVGKGLNFRGLYYAGHDHSFKAFDPIFEAKMAGVPADSKGAAARAKQPGYPGYAVPPALNFVLNSNDGKPVNLGRYAGKVLLLVNVASRCGNTPQYAALESLYVKYKEKGFEVLAFPANQFGGQEPGTDVEIRQFCTDTYHVTFPLFAKIVVKGDGQAPLYKYLTGRATDPRFGGDIEWNFAKFLVNRKGEIVGRFAARTSPATPEVVAAIEKELAEGK